MDSSSDAISTIYNSRNILMELLESRGYDVSEYNEFSISDVHSMAQNNQLDLLLTGKDGKKIFVKYYLAKKLGANNVQDFVDDIFHLEKILTPQDDLLIISKDPANDTMINLLKEIWAINKIYVAVMNISSLGFNILKHTLVPPHPILSSREKAHIQEKYNIMENSQFPEISRFDPVALAIGLRPDELCEIDRSSKTAITAKYYRLCQ